MLRNESRNKRLFATLVIAAAALIGSLVYSQTVPAVPRIDQKTQGRTDPRSALIGNTYEAVELFSVRTAPFSGNVRQLTQGTAFTVVGLEVDPQDGRTADYALSLRPWGRVYIGTGDLQHLIGSRAVLSSRSAAQARQGSSRGTRGSQEDQGSPYHSTFPATSDTVTRFAAGESDSRDLPTLVIVAGGLFVVLWVLWHTMGFMKAASFVLIVILVGYLCIMPRGSLSLVPFSGLVILLATLLGVRMFLILTAIFGAFSAVGCVAYVIYNHAATILVVVLASAILAVVVCSFVLFRRMFGGTSAHIGDAGGSISPPQLR